MSDTIFSGKALCVIAIMMIATYTFTGVIYPDEKDNEYSKILIGFNLSPEMTPLLMDFPTWIQIQYMMGYDKVVWGNNVEDYPYYHHITVRYVEWHYQEDNKIFEKFGTNINSGLAWFNSDWMQETGVLEWFLGGLGASSRGTFVLQGYNHYHADVTKILEEGEKIKEGKKSLLDIIWDFVGSIVNGFVALMKILTFTNIPNAPLWLVGILNIVFIPMWIYLVVGIAPYVARLIEAGAKFLDALIPF